MDAVASRMSSFDFLRGDSELSGRIRDFDWEATSLGPIDTWPQIVRTTVALILRSPVPIVTLWGEKGVMVYNDAYAEFSGGRHPKILGMDVLEAWPEAADWNRQVMDTVFHAGENLSVQDMELVLYRRGIGEPVWMNLDYSPVLDEDGETAAVIAIVVETTAKVRAERQLRGERERLRRMFEQAPGFMALLEGPNHVYGMANAAYFDLVGGRELLGKTVAEALPEVAEQGFVDLLHSVYSSREPHVGHAIPVRLQRAGGVEEERFVDFVYQPLVDDDSAITGVFVQGHDVTERKRSERHQQLLVGELNHRVKNTLAIVQSLAHQSFHADTPSGDAIRRFEGRLEALARAHSLLTDKNWESASVSEVVRGAIAPFCPPERCSIEGPDVRLPPQTAVSLALALHELATNAAKYGALSSPSGKIEVSWSASDDELDFRWVERGGPRVEAPERRGFGTRMIERTLASEFGGTATLDFAPEGVTCRVIAKLPSQAD